VVRPRRFLIFLLVVAVALLLGQHLRLGKAEQPVAPRVAVIGAVPPSASPPTERAALAGSVGTSGKFAYAPGYGAVLGGHGTIRPFKIAVELPAGPATAAAFADEVGRALGDPRSWIAARRFRFQRVPYPAHAEFVVYLASAGTSQRMCRRGGLETSGYTSCRLPREVIINDDRWQGAMPGYGAPLATYRAYVINHEVGHQLGYGHESCPGRGRPAPVMMQQTYGLRGCTANAWPYLDGARYTGPPAV
jgi:hypothetical protein